MKRVTGIGGIFFKAQDPAALREWYRRHLGIESAAWGGTAFRWRTDDNPDGVGTTAWSVFAADSAHFGVGAQRYMVNYRVDDLDALIAALRQEGCQVDDKTDSSEYGKFGWVTDPEGNRIELWEPPAGK